MTLTGGRNAAEQAIFEAIIQRGDAKRYSVLGFGGQSHGDSLVFAQFAHPKHSLGLGWPTISFPSNASEEERSLSAAKQALEQKRAENNPVAAIIIEPTNSTTGQVASHSFISQLRTIAHDYDAALIVDETNTGCGASGHGFWQYSGPADFVVFGKRTQV